MGRIDELVSAEFAKWEQRGRGWQVWPTPVRPEPPFEEFTGYRLPEANLPVDDGIRPTFLASLFDSLERKLNSKPSVVVEEVIEPTPVESEASLSSELLASLPASIDVADDAFQAFLESLHDCAEPTGFELVGNHGSVTVQFASSPSDAPILQRQLSAFLPTLSFIPAEGTLASRWDGTDGIGFIVDFGLAHEFMLPLQTGHGIDPFVGLVGVLNELGQDEVAVFQVLFQPVTNAWPGSIWRSVTDAKGRALFVNRLMFLPGTKEKLSSPLFGVVVRLAAKATDFERSSAIVRNMASALRSFTKLEGNRLIPLDNDEFSFDERERDLTLRQSCRSGMLLNRDELQGLVHLPSDDVTAPRLQRERIHTKAAPGATHSSSGLLLGDNRHAGRTAAVHLSAEQRVRHTHIIGASGTGKSTLLFNMIRQDIEAGQGVAVLDPHGDLVDRILGIIPRSRIEDVVLVDPSDEEYSVGFNILSAKTELEKNLLASDLVSVFKRLSTSWGDQMNSVLKNAVLAFLESDRGGTLADLQRFLLETPYRNEFLNSVKDPAVVYYWKKGFTQLAGTKSIGSILTRLDTFLGHKPLRHMVSQPINRLDFGDILDSGKIFLAKLPHGAIGKVDAQMLGALLVSKVQQAAMARQRLAAGARRDFWLYIDEFANFITPSMAEILTEARKYRLGLILAHHELHQLEADPDVASAVLTHCNTRICFRVGNEDAKTLAAGFTSFKAHDLQNLGTGEAIGRIERTSNDFNFTVRLPKEEASTEAELKRIEIITASRRKHAMPRAAIEALIQRNLAGHEEQVPASPSAKPTKATESKPAHTQVPVDAPVVPPTIESRPAADPQLTAKVEAAPKPVGPAPPSQPGRGGPDHRSIQKRLTSLAEELGYRAETEYPILGGQGSVDVALLMDGVAMFACEIDVKSTAAKEFEHVVHNLQAGFPRVAVIAADPEQLAAIRELVEKGLSGNGAERVGYYSPDGFEAHLRELASVPKVQKPLPTPNLPKEKKILGLKVRFHHPTLTEAERKAKEALARRQIDAVTMPTASSL